MSVSKYALAGVVFAATVIGTAIPMTASAASEIKNVADCVSEGGTMTNVKGSDYCLVQIRPKEYSGVEYDGNQLGVVECPGNKLNDGVFCMYPVTIEKTADDVEPMTEAEDAGQTLADKADESVKDETETEAKAGKQDEN
ncbi:MAG: hypothetical protein COA69_02100 [Robiginitomaculum sp.]|nr:MAG: hypothetical protein COA69_02100 [Robiginitomaculum sp.]